MPYDKSLYHPNFFKWQKKLCLEQANYTCQHCKRKRGDECLTKKGKTGKVIIQVAHVNDDPWNPDPELIALCAPCHLEYDKTMHAENGNRTKQHNKHAKKIKAGEQPIPMQWPEKTKKYPKGRLAAEIRYNEDGSYSFFGAEGDEYINKVVFSDSTAYFTWLSNLSSFHFEGREGPFTARKETRQRGGEYWYAYRRLGKQFGVYMGTTSKLTVSHLEDIAKGMQKRIDSQPAKDHKPRKRPVHRAVLLARIEEQDRLIAHLKAQIQDLKREKVELEQEIAALREEPGIDHPQVWTTCG